MLKHYKNHNDDKELYDILYKFTKLFNFDLKLLQKKKIDLESFISTKCIMISSYICFERANFFPFYFYFYMKILSEAYSLALTKTCSSQHVHEFDHETQIPVSLFYVCKEDHMAIFDCHLYILCTSR